MKRYRLGILATHPIQYDVPWYQTLARNPEIDLRVYFAHQQTPEGQADAGFGIRFEWDIPLLEGYSFQFLKNRSSRPDGSHFFGCDTPEVKDIIAHGGFDAWIVQGWHTKSFWQAIFACWRYQTPLLVRGDSQLNTERSWLKRGAKYGLYRWFIPRFDGYLVVGERSKAYYRHYGAKENKMFWVPRAVDNDFFDARARVLAAERTALRRQWGLPSEAMVFLFAGKLVARKRPMDLLRAISSTATSSNSAWILMVGDGMLRKELEHYVRQNHLPVRFTGFLNQTEMPKAYTASDVLVLPSDGSETWGLVVNEAMASGLPAVVSDRVGCAPDLVKSDETGESFSCGNVNELTHILQRMASNPVMVKAMSDKARVQIKNYSIACAAEGTMAALQSVARREVK